MDNKASTPKSLFVGDMWAVFNFADPNTRYQKFLQNGKPRFTHMLDGLLLYDEVVVPTQDFMSLSLLVGVLGARAVIELLEGGDLRFIRLKGGVSYVGNGGGLLPFEMLDENKQLTACFASDEDAVAWALGGLNPPSTDPALPKAVLKRVTTIDANKMKDELRHETYTDILNSPYLKNFFAIRNKHLDKLAGIGPDEVRCYGGPDADSRKNDEIDMVLDICAANLELRMAQFAECDDSSTANPIGHLLKAKVDRTFGNQVPFEALVHLMELDGIPDVGSGVLESPIGDRSPSLIEIIKLKRSKDGMEFRKWFHENCRGDPADIARNYIELLKTVPTINKLPTRILRFLVTSALGLIPGIGSVVGAGASAVDSFFVEKWFRGSSPKFFIDDLRQTIKAAQPNRGK